jgi:hypothetical protein
MVRGVRAGKTVASDFSGPNRHSWSFAWRNMWPSFTQLISRRTGIGIRAPIGTAGSGVRVEPTAGDRPFVLQLHGRRVHVIGRTLLRLLRGLRRDHEPGQVRHRVRAAGYRTEIHVRTIGRAARSCRKTYR